MSSSQHALTKRFALFLFGCVPVRLALVYIVAAKIVTPTGLKYMAAAAALIAIGFLTIFIGGLRRSGMETGGAPIWWNILRPVHALMWGAFAYYAWTGMYDIAWKVLLLDVIIGIASFFIYHITTGNFQKVFS